MRKRPKSIESDSGLAPVTTPVSCSVAPPPAPKTITAPAVLPSVSKIGATVPATERPPRVLGASNNPGPSS